MPCATALDAVAESAIIAVAMPQTIGKMRMLNLTQVDPEAISVPSNAGDFACWRQPGRRRLRGRG
jgi:hypothetical protein